MIKYKQIYLDYFGLTTADWIACTWCKVSAIDFHHGIFKSQGGKDVIENIIPVCRHCHTHAHSDKEFNNHLINEHLQNL